MNAVIICSGDMGTAIAYALFKLGFNVSLADNDAKRINDAKNKLASFGYKVTSDFLVEIGCNYTTPKTMIDSWGSPDIVVSAVPWNLTYEVAKICTIRKIRYCDLGGNPDVSADIHDLAIKTNISCSVFTDLGLAPGWANIIAEKGFKEKGEAKSVRLYVGGLPEVPCGSLGYSCVFSSSGLVNEYLGKCEVLKNGKVEFVKALSEIKNHNCDTGLYESAHTKGGLSKTLELMQNRGVDECFYKTLRYRGHFEKVKFLIDECKLQDIHFDRDRNGLHIALENACPKTSKDKVLIDVHVDDWNYSRCIMHNEHWTAMQMATAFPAASVASIMATGQLDHKKVLDYSDVPIELFESQLSKIGFNHG